MQLLLFPKLTAELALSRRLAHSRALHYSFLVNRRMGMMVELLYGLLVGIEASG